MNNNVFKTGLLFGVATSVLTFSAPAMAQGSDDAIVSGDIIVTARRVEERLQDVPISITVFNQEELNKRNIVIATDLATYTPSLAVNQRYGPEKSSFSLRGFNQDQNTAPTVGVYFAEVVGVRAQGGTTSGNTVGAGAFTDLENVQVVKGPQGTLFGRNTTGGAIMLTPTKPTANLEGYVEGTYGNYDQQRVQGALNVPLADTFRVRLTFDRNRSDGYMKNRADLSDGSPPYFNDTNYFYGRLSIVADLTPDLENYTIFHYSHSDTNAYAARIEICDRDVNANPFAGLPAAFLRNAFATAACDQIDRQAARGDGRLDVEVRNPGGYLDLEQWQLINTTTWQASDSLTVKNIMSYGEFRERTKFALNSSNFFVPQWLGLTGNTAVGQPLGHILLDTQPGHYNSAQSTFTEEMQLQGDLADGRLNFVVGGYLEFSRPMGFNAGRTSVFGYCDPPAELACQAPLGFGIISESRTKLSFDNHGIFGQATYNITDQLSLTGGIRYTFDKIKGVTQSNRYTFAPIPGLGTVIAARNCNDNLRNKNPDGSNIDISDPIFLPVPGAGLVQVAGGDGSNDVTKCETRLTNKSNKPTWLINLDYKPTPDILLYAKWARGYRQGGMTFTNPGSEIWGPEQLDSYEVGTKISFRGAVPGYFNLAGFYNDITDQQVITNAIAKPDSGIAGGNVVANAGVAESYGLEVDAGATFFDSLSLSLGYTYLKTKIKAFDPPVPPEGSPFSAFLPTSDVGLPFTLSPKHRLTATATYTLPLDESIGKVSVGATFTHTSSQYATFTSPIGKIPSVDLLNLNFDWKSVAGSPIDLAVFATNVTNEIYPVNVGSGFASFGYDNTLYAKPRIYGARVRFNFGQ